MGRGPRGRPAVRARLDPRHADRPHRAGAARAQGPGAGRERRAGGAHVVHQPRVRRGPPPGRRRERRRHLARPRGRRGAALVAALGDARQRLGHRAPPPPPQRPGQQQALVEAALAQPARPQRDRHQRHPDRGRRHPGGGLGGEHLGQRASPPVLQRGDERRDRPGVAHRLARAGQRPPALGAAVDRHRDRAAAAAAPGRREVPQRRQARRAGGVAGQPAARARRRDEEVERREEAHAPTLGRGPCRVARASSRIRAGRRASAVTPGGAATSSRIRVPADPGPEVTRRAAPPPGSARRAGGGPPPR